MWTQVSDSIRRSSHVPNRWGEGLLFAFSGMDGATDSTSGFVGTATAGTYGLLFHTPRRRVLTLDVGPGGEVLAATGDVLVVEPAKGGEVDEFVAVFTAWHSLTGVLPAGSALSLRFEGERKGTSGRYQTTLDGVQGDAVVLVRRGQRWAVAYGRDEDGAKDRAEAALKVDLPGVIEARLGIYRDLPALDSQQLERLLGKCVSVMRANTLAPEGVIDRRWSTPDRVPHRHMWLWDSVFHTFGMNLLDPALGWDFLRAVLDRQREDGMIPHCMHVDGVTSRITQPPILAWGVWENYEYLEDREHLAYALPRLEAYLTWNLEHRDANGDGLLAWFIEGSPLSRSGESGMDNSPRFDGALSLDAVDFSTFQALDMAATARIADALGKHKTAAIWQARADRTARQIHALLWDDDLGFYCDRTMEGTHTGVRAVSGFLPLLLDDVPQDRVDRIISQLRDPDAFWTAFPVPSVSIDDPEWSTDMWRGATWLNFDYLVILGLLKEGYPDLVVDLRSRWLHYVRHYYGVYGVIFEFYDAKDEVPPVACDRKGPRQAPYDLRVKMDSIRDYHWSAALTTRLLLDRTLDQGGI